MLDALGCWCAIMLACGMVAYHQRWWTILPAMVLVGSRYYGLFIIGHDGFHQRLFKDPHVNDLFNDCLLMAPIGAITHLNKRNHLAHHQFLATDADPDRHKHACFNKADAMALLGYLAGIRSVVLAIRHVFLMKDGAGQATQDRYTLRDLAVLAGWQVVLWGGLTWVFGWWGVPVLWILPVYVFTFLADNLRSFAEHSQPYNDSRADRHRLIVYVSNPLERFFVAPMNMNYHAIHHLWPSIPYYALPAANREVRAASAAVVEWRGSYFAYLLRYLRALPLEECRPTTV